MVSENTLNSLNAMNGIAAAPHFLYQDVIRANRAEWRKMVKRCGDAAVFLFPLMLGRRSNEGTGFGPVCIEWELMGRN
jgi:hypothetical protein